MERDIFFNMRRKGLGQILCGLILFGASSCTWDQVSPAADCSTSPIEMIVLESKDTDCGISNGSFTVNATGGEAPYSYTTSEGSNTDGVFDNINAGSYTVTVVDAKGCSSEIVVSIANLEGVNLDEVVIADAGCDTQNGFIRITASGGKEPLIYSINGGIEQEDNLFSGLNNGNYSISVKDQNGCEITQNVKILSGVSFENTIEGIINNRCTSCHGVSTSPSFGSYAEIKAQAGRIMARTTAKTMPPGGGLSQSEIDAIACWVNDGALSN